MGIGHLGFLGKSPASREGIECKNLLQKSDADPQRRPWWLEFRYQEEESRDGVMEAVKMQEEHDPSCLAPQVIGTSLGVTPREMGNK